MSEISTVESLGGGEEGENRSVIISLKQMKIKHGRTCNILFLTDEE